MQNILNHTQSYNYNWGQSIRDYSNKYNILSFNQQPVTHITHQMISKSDREYNPILQVYSNSNKENNLRNQEKNDLINTIVRNQDKALKTEQTYNIINLRDKLKGLENEKNYPQLKSELKQRKNLETSRVNYNILSNLPLSQHHYDKPENRPKCENSQPQRPSKHLKGAEQRDYDIISTKYKQFHDEKTKVDNEIKKIQTAKLFYKKNDYNIIKGRFFDDSKEEEFQKKLEYEKSIHGKEYKKNLPRCAKGQSELYNLINMQTVNKEELMQADEYEANKKKRFKLRYEMENYYRDQSINEKNKKDMSRGSKYSYMRYKEGDKRQYDIIDLKEKPFREHTKIVKKDNLTDWEKIVNGAGKNNTFKQKEIYKDIYDYSEVGLNYDKYKNNRNTNLRELPSIEADTNFGVSNKKPKNNVKINNVKKDSVRDRMIQFDKEKFFKPPKNLFSDVDNKVITKNVEFNKQSQRFEENKEKNMRNKKYSKGMFGFDN